MSDARLHLEFLPRANEPARIAARRLRWFRNAFTRYVREMERVLGLRFEIEQSALADIFVAWLRAVERQDPEPPQSDLKARRDFYDFSASLMLRELVARMPLSLRDPAQPGTAETPAMFWPEAYVCTLFCLAVRNLVLSQEFGEDALPAASLDDLRGWWSFRENATRDPAFAAGFLQYLMGHDPNWSMPDNYGAAPFAQAP